MSVKIARAPLHGRCMLFSDYKFSFTDLRLVDECKLQTDQCHQHAQCSDRKDGYVCSCQTGFTGDGKQCMGSVIQTEIFVFQVNLASVD